jgi:hypothetical protein
MELLLPCVPDAWTYRTVACEPAVKPFAVVQDGPQLGGDDARGAGTRESDQLG